MRHQIMATLGSSVVAISNTPIPHIATVIQKAAQNRVMRLDRLVKYTNAAIAIDVTATSNPDRANGFIEWSAEKFRCT